MELKDGLLSEFKKYVPNIIICKETYEWCVENIGGPKFIVLCDVIFLVRLQGKFEIYHSWDRSKKNLFRDHDGDPSGDFIASRHPLSPE